MWTISMRSPYPDPSWAAAPRRSACLLLVVLDQAQHVLPDEPPYRARTVLRDRDRAVGPDDEPGRLQDAALLLVEGPERGRRILERQPVPDGHAKRELRDRLGGLILGVSGRSDGADALRLQFVLCPVEGSQLLLAVRSPVGAI